LMEVRRLPSFLTGFDVTCILWVVKHRLILSVRPQHYLIWRGWATSLPCWITVPSPQGTLWI